MKAWGITDKGLVRQQNQDVFQKLMDKDEKNAVLIVCDGMGGAKSGNVASSLAAETFMTSVMNAVPAAADIQEVGACMKEAVNAANWAVFEKSEEDSDCTGMGTTLVAAAIMTCGTVVLNVGDSRAYHISASGITQITKDHSVVEDMIDRGDLTRLEAKNHPNKNLITRALGTAPGIEPDVFFPDIKEGEYLLLCSDGLTNTVGEQEILSEILHGPEVQESCERLIALSIEHGAPDNVTALILQK